MSNFNVELPVWNNTGAKPPNATIDAGWQVGDRPPAPWFNWQWNKVYESILELRNYLDEQALNKPPNIITATYNHETNEYIITTPKPITVYQDGLTLNILVDGDSNDNTTVNVDNLGSAPLRFGQTLDIMRRTLVNGRIYTLIYTTTINGFIVLNMTNRLEYPSVYFGDLNALLYDGNFISSVDATNLPKNSIDNDVFLISSRRIKDQDGAITIFQTALSVVNLNEYDRLLNNDGTIVYDWREPTGRSNKSILNSDLLENKSGLGMAINYTSTTPYSITVQPGSVYFTNYGLVQKLSSQTITFNESTNGTYYIYINGDANCIIAQSLPANYIDYIASFVLTTGTISNMNMLVKGIFLKGAVNTVTQPLNTKDSTIASTLFVDNTIKDNISIYEERLLETEQRIYEYIDKKLYERALLHIMGVSL